MVFNGAPGVGKTTMLQKLKRMDTGNHSDTGIVVVIYPEILLLL